MRPIHRSPHLAAVFRCILSLVVALFCGAILAQETSAALATGSITARVYLCPDSVQLATVEPAAPQSPQLAACAPLEGEIAVLQLRPASGGPPTPGTPLAPGVFRWSFLEFGEYRFDSNTAQPHFSRLLIANGDDVPLVDQESGVISIGSGELNVERRLYFFAAEGADGEEGHGELTPIVALDLSEGVVPATDPRE